MEVAIIVHGGAGDWNLAYEPVDEAEAICAKAAALGQKILLEGGSALDAVEQAIRIMEDSPVLDAGRGSSRNSWGGVEMDALIMDGRSLRMGAVAAIQRVRNPISLARRVMTETEHNFLVGEGAGVFADFIAFPRCTEDDLLVASKLIGSDGDSGSYASSGNMARRSSAHGDTVGAAALDGEGNLAAGTSTGGTQGKLPGRVGDSPQVGSGGYADNLTAAASATGHGEALMKLVISKKVCDFVESGLTPAAACEAAIRQLERRVGGSGGLIAVDARGRVGKAFNTAAMPYAWARGNGAVKHGH